MYNFQTRNSAHWQENQGDTTRDRTLDVWRYRWCCLLIMAPTSARKPEWYYEDILWGITTHPNQETKPMRQWSYCQYSKILWEQHVIENVGFSQGISAAESRDFTDFEWASDVTMEVSRVGSLHCSPVGFCMLNHIHFTLYDLLLLSHEIFSQVYDCTILAGRLEVETGK